MAPVTIYFVAMAATAAQDKAAAIPPPSAWPVERVATPPAPPPPPPPPMSTPLRPQGPNLPPTARSALSGLIGDWDYPPAALREDRSGNVTVALTVSRWGRVADCQVTASSGHADLDTVTCDRLATRASFWPATDASGKDIGGTVSKTVRWALPEDEPAMAGAAPPPIIVVPTGGRAWPRMPGMLPGFLLRPGKLTMHLALDAQGKATACRLEASGGIEAAAKMSDQLCKDAREQGFRSAPNGAALPAEIEASIEVKTVPRGK